jgi:membrane associated rhomboid family serine protease
VEQRYLHMLAPMLRPLTVALVAAPCLWLGALLGPGVVNTLLLPTAAFGAVYGVLSAVFVLTKQERRRLMAAVGRAPSADNARESGLNP